MLSLPWPYFHYFEITAYSIWICIILYAIYLTVNSRSHNSKLFLQKRNVSLFYALNCASIMLINSFALFGFCCIHYSEPWGLIYSLSWSFWVSSTFIWICLLAIKNWLIYYKDKWSFYIAQSKWQQIINPNVLTDDLYTAQNWFIANHHKYGHFGYVVKLFGGVAVCCGILVSLVWLLPPFVSLSGIYYLSITVIMTLYMPWVSLYIYCVWKTPPLDDPFNIHWEARWHAKLLAMNSPHPPALALYSMVTGDMRGFFLSAFIGSIFIFLMLFVSTYFLVPKHTKQNRRSSKKSEQSITLEMVLTNAQTLNLFMNHLSKELSI